MHSEVMSFHTMSDLKNFNCISTPVPVRFYTSCSTYNIQINWVICMRLLIKLSSFLTWSCVVVHLRDDNVALWGSSSSNVLVQNVLWHLSCLSAACSPTDDHYRIVVDGVQYLLLKLFDRQLLSLMQPLPLKQKSGAEHKTRFSFQIPS